MVCISLRAPMDFSNSFPVNFLPTANYITMLENGRIVRNQVSYDSVAPSEWGILEENMKVAKCKTATEHDTTEPGNEAGLTARSTAPAERVGGPKPQVIDLQEIQLSRRTGDTECYKIYLRSMGWNVLVVLLVVSVVHAGIGKMPRKCLTASQSPTRYSR